MTQYKMVDGKTVEMTPEEVAAQEAMLAGNRQQQTLGSDTLDMGPNIAQQLGAHVNVKS